VAGPALRRRHPRKEASMRLFEVQWSSGGNIDKGTIIVKATSINEAQNKFWEWLQKRPVFGHMWQLSFQFAEIEEPEVIE
jgi:hypothetical protein